MPHQKQPHHNDSSLKSKGSTRPAVSVAAQSAGDVTDVSYLTGNLPVQLQQKRFATMAQSGLVGNNKLSEMAQQSQSPTVLQRQVRPTVRNEAYAEKYAQVKSWVADHYDVDQNQVSIMDNEFRKTCGWQVIVNYAPITVWVEPATSLLDLTENQIKAMASPTHYDGALNKRIPMIKEWVTTAVEDVFTQLRAVQSTGVSYVDHNFDIGDPEGKFVDGQWWTYIRYKVDLDLTQPHFLSSSNWTESFEDLATIPVPVVKVTESDCRAIVYHKAYQDKKHEFGEGQGYVRSWYTEAMKRNYENALNNPECHREEMEKVLNNQRADLQVTNAGEHELPSERGNPDNMTRQVLKVAGLLNPILPKQLTQTLVPPTEAEQGLSNIEQWVADEADELGRRIVESGKHIKSVPLGPRYISPQQFDRRVRVKAAGTDINFVRAEMVTVGQQHKTRLTYNLNIYTQPLQINHYIGYETTTDIPVPPHMLTRRDFDVYKEHYIFPNTPAAGQNDVQSDEYKAKLLLNYQNFNLMHDHLKRPDLIDKAEAMAQAGQQFTSHEPANAHSRWHRPDHEYKQTWQHTHDLSHRGAVWTLINPNPENLNQEHIYQIRWGNWVRDGSFTPQSLTPKILLYRKEDFDEVPISFEITPAAHVKFGATGVSHDKSEDINDGWYRP